MRIVELLQQDNFELLADYLKYIHKYLFQDVCEFAGEFRKIDFSKHEKVLNNDSVAYGYYKTLIQSLEYDINLEKEKNYKDMSIVEVIKILLILHLVYVKSILLEKVTREQQQYL